MENKFRRYLLYALGEMLLVVIGILIALQIDNWNENRKDRALELTLLEEVHTALENDLQMVENWLSTLEKTNQSFIRVVELKAEKQDTFDELYEHLSRVQSYGIMLSFTKSPYEGLMSIGLDKIKNPELRQQLSSFYGHSIPVTEDFINDVVRTGLHLRSELFADIFDVNAVKGEAGIRNSFKISSHDQYYQNPKFDEMLLSAGWSLPVAIRVMKDLKQNGDRLSLLINNELGLQPTD